MCVCERVLSTQQANNATETHKTISVALVKTKAVARTYNSYSKVPRLLRMRKR